MHPRCAVSRKRAMQRHSPYGVNRCAIEHNAAFCKIAPFTALRCVRWDDFAERGVMSCATPRLHRLACARAWFRSGAARTSRTRKSMVRVTARAPASLAAALRRQSDGCAAGNATPTALAMRCKGYTRLAPHDRACLVHRRQGQALRALRGLDGIGCTAARPNPGD